MQEQAQKKANTTAAADNETPQKARVTHNLDTGRDEPLRKSDEEEDLMDFGSGSGGGSAGDGGAA